MPALSIHNLAVRFRGMSIPALDIPTLQISKGEKLVICGASGSGKTTFVNMVCGLDRPDRGSVIWNGVAISSMSETKRDAWRAREVGLLMQEFHLFPGLSALQNVLLPVRFRTFFQQTPLRNRAVALLESVGIGNPNQPVATMSRGEMQRVALARALLSKPRVLVADEPTASLDAENGEIVSTLLDSVAEEHEATLIVVTHDPILAKRLGRRITFDQGKISQDTGAAS